MSQLDKDQMVNDLMDLGIREGELVPLAQDLRARIIGWHEHAINDAIKKLSYHTGIPTQDLQAYLDSKDEVREFTNPQPNKEISK